MTTKLRKVPAWSRYFFRREEVVKTTWLFRGCVAAALALGLYVTRPIWIPAVGHSLTCGEQPQHSDAILIDNFDHNYLLFERASVLRDDGVAQRVLVLQFSSSEEGPTIEEGIVEVMARTARLDDVERIPVSSQAEPISLNVARRVRTFLLARQIRSIVVVTAGFRAARSLLVYRSVLEPGGITVGCVPVFDATTPSTWADTWHGVEEVALQFFKLQYYRFYVFPFRA
jgi:hypothetical protein